MKLVLLFASVLIFSQTDAQNFPTQQRSMVVELGGYTCVPCYTWAKPMLDYFKGKYGNNLIAMDMQIETGNDPMQIFSNAASYLQDKYMIYPFGQSNTTPIMFFNHRIKYNNGNDSLYTVTGSQTIDSMNALPAVASPVFQVTRIGTDSMVVLTKTKFLRNASGNYRLSVWLVQDSIYFEQAGAGVPNIYHMHHLMGPDLDYYTSYPKIICNGNDSFFYTLSNGQVAQNTIVTKTFHYKLRQYQTSKNIHPVVLVTKLDTISLIDYSSNTYYPTLKDLYVNANEQEGITYTGIPSVTRAAEANIYPNPAHGTVYVEGKDLEAYALIDYMGKMVKTASLKSGSNAIDIGVLSPGIYFLKIADANGGDVTKEVKVE